MASPAKQQYRYTFRRQRVDGLEIDFFEKPTCRICGGKGLLFSFQPERYRCRECVAKAVARELWR